MNDPFTIPDIDRLLAALHHTKGDRVPNFEIIFNSRFCDQMLGPANKGRSFWEMPPEDAVSLAQLVGQDAIVCSLATAFPPEGSVLSMAELRPFLAQPPDREAVRRKLRSCHRAVKGTKVGVAVRLTGPMTAVYMSTGPIAIQSFMLHLYDQPEMISAFMDKVVELTLAIIETAKPENFDLFYIGDDLCDNSGYLISPAMVAEIWAPRYRKIIDAAHACGKPVINHCCGKQAPLLPYLIEWGVEATHPLQSGANDIFAVKRQYGDKITLVGNIAVATLSFGTREEVIAETREKLAKLGTDGGYVACSDHSIIDSVQPENFLAMVETVHRFGRY